MLSRLNKVALAFNAVICVAAAPPPQNMTADWLHKPRPEDLAQVWPRAAIAAAKDGKAELICTVTVEGLTEQCSVASEAPAGFGFGDAALILSQQFRFRPATRDGVPYESSVRIPIGFSGIANIAQRDLGDPVLNAPHFDQAPTRADVQTAYPHGAKTPGFALLQCKVPQSGPVWQCWTLEENPMDVGFSHAADVLAKKFTVSTPPRGTNWPKNLSVRIPFYFGLGGATPIVKDHALSPPTFVADRDFPSVNTVFPAKAKTSGVATGSATLTCVAQPQGWLADCAVKAEAPSGLGFGEAALKSASHFRINPWTSDGRAVDGARIELPIVFNASDASPPAASSAAPKA